MSSTVQISTFFALLKHKPLFFERNMTRLANGACVLSVAYLGALHLPLPFKVKKK